MRISGRFKLRQTTKCINILPPHTSSSLALWSFVSAYWLVARQCNKEKNGLKKSLAHAVSPLDIKLILQHIWSALPTRTGLGESTKWRKARLMKIGCP